MAIFSGLTPKSAEEEHLNQQINIDEFQKDDIDSNEKSSKRFKYTFHELVENEVDSDNEENTKNEAIANEPSKVVQSSEDLEILYENTQLTIHGKNPSKPVESKSKASSDKDDNSLANESETELLKLRENLKKQLRKEIVDTVISSRKSPSRSPTPLRSRSKSKKDRSRSRSKRNRRRSSSRSSSSSRTSSASSKSRGSNRRRRSRSRRRIVRRRRSSSLSSASRSPSISRKKSKRRRRSSSSSRSRSRSRSKSSSSSILPSSKHRIKKVSEKYVAIFKNL